MTFGLVLGRRSQIGIERAKMLDTLLVIWPCRPIIQLKALRLSTAGERSFRKYIADRDNELTAPDSGMVAGDSLLRCGKHIEVIEGIGAVMHQSGLFRKNKPAAKQLWQNTTLGGWHVLKAIRCGRSRIAGRRMPAQGSL